MNKSNLQSLWLSLSLDKTLALPLHMQLAASIRGYVHEQKLVSGDRLPPSRVMAGELSVSRITVTSAYDQLVSEGYLIGQQGSGIFIAPNLENLPRQPCKNSITEIDAPVSAPAQYIAFDSVAPDQREFPFQEWARLLNTIWRSPEPTLLARYDVLGWYVLREAIAAHLLSWRGLSCHPSQVVVTSGLSETMSLIAAITLKKGDSVAVENPGHKATRDVLLASGMCLRPVPVDEYGLDVEKLGQSRAAVVTPSLQFPLGVTMPLFRRLRLLEWAHQNKSYLIEDDFDGEYRYTGQPLPALASLDREGRTIYVGSFSKVMFPALRLGFIVLPPALIANAKDILLKTGAKASIVSQPALAQFITSGSFAAHIRRMRRLYAQRQKTLVTAVKTYADGLINAEPVAAGMHLIATLAPEVSGRILDYDLAALAKQSGVSVAALSSYYVGDRQQQGLVMGFAGFNDSEIITGVKTLSSVTKQII